MPQEVYTIVKGSDFEFEAHPLSVNFKHNLKINTPIPTQQQEYIQANLDNFKEASMDIYQRANAPIRKQHSTHAQIPTGYYDKKENGEYYVHVGLTEEFIKKTESFLTAEGLFYPSNNAKYKLVGCEGSTLKSLAKVSDASFQKYTRGTESNPIVKTFGFFSPANISPYKDNTPIIYEITPEFLDSLVDYNNSVFNTLTSNTSENLVFDLINPSFLTTQEFVEGGLPYFNVLKTLGLSGSNQVSNLNLFLQKLKESYTPVPVLPIPLSLMESFLADKPTEYTIREALPNTPVKYYTRSQSPNKTALEANVKILTYEVFKVLEPDNLLKNIVEKFEGLRIRVNFEDEIDDEGNEIPFEDSHIVDTLLTAHDESTLSINYDDQSFIVPKDMQIKAFMYLAPNFDLTEQAFASLVGESLYDEYLVTSTSLRSNMFNGYLNGFITIRGLPARYRSSVCVYKPKYTTEKILLPNVTSEDRENLLKELNDSQQIVRPSSRDDLIALYPSVSISEEAAQFILDFVSKHVEYTKLYLDCLVQYMTNFRIDSEKFLSVPVQVTFENVKTHLKERINQNIFSTTRFATDYYTPNNPQLNNMQTAVPTPYGQYTLTNKQTRNNSGDLMNYSAVPFHYKIGWTLSDQERETYKIKFDQKYNVTESKEPTTIDPQLPDTPYHAKLQADLVKADAVLNKVFSKTFLSKDNFNKVLDEFCEKQLVPNRMQELRKCIREAHTEAIKVVKSAKELISKRDEVIKSAILPSSIQYAVNLLRHKSLVSVLPSSQRTMEKMPNNIKEKFYDELPSKTDKLAVIWHLFNGIEGVIIKEARYFNTIFTEFDIRYILTSFFVDKVYDQTNDSELLSLRGNRNAHTDKIIKYRLEKKSSKGQDLEKLFTNPKVIEDVSKQLFLGIEIELSVKSSRRAFVEEMTRNTKIGDHCLIKSDASIQPEGGEIVTVPATLDKHKEVFDDMFNSQFYKDYYSVVNEAHPSCGLHVHLSRNFVDSGSKIAGPKLVDFLNREDNMVFLEGIAGRKLSTNHRYCRVWEKDPQKPANSLLGIASKRNLQSFGMSDSGRNSTINLRKTGTYELRLFASTFDKNILYARLEFAEALAIFCKSTPLRTNKAADFIDFVMRKENAKRYKHLLSLLANLNFVGSERKEVKLKGETKPLLVTRFSENMLRTKTLTRPIRPTTPTQAYTAEIATNLPF